MSQDPVTWRVVQRLKENLIGGLTSQSIKDASFEEIYGLLHDLNMNKVNFYKHMSYFNIHILGKSC